MYIRLLLLIVLLLSAVPTSRAADIDWTKLRAEAVQLLQELIKIDTTNPPGNELAAALHLQKLLEADGIETRVLDVAPGRANLYARFKGDGSRRPLILLSHTDVVMAEPQRWTVPPFSGELRDGFIYGRGATDMKATATVHVTLMRLIKRLNIPLKRDLILLAVADEEAGGTGAISIIEKHPDLIRGAEFLLNEGDVVYLKDGKVQQYGVDVMEKAALWLRIIAKGPAGHGSIPLANSSVERLLRALERLRKWETPIQVPPAVAESYRMRAQQQADPVLRNAYLNLERALKNPARRKKLLSDSTLNAEVRNTFTITGLQGSDKVNVIPGTAWAQVDARLLPGETPAAFIAKLRRVLNDPELEIETLEGSIPTGSSVDTALMHAIRKVAARRDPGVPVIPTMLTSSTDSAKFRSLGITAYGFEPFKLDDNELSRSHGDDERVSVENLGFALQFLYEVILELN
ncbi:MAG TPA: M20/M25/M40 family metallo-hydrolase [Pyrinomonadaceae bacterium]|nr:M20/M25/M40 family metallo-hydrolase [Pyrinomonadaceae bacterium]